MENCRLSYISSHPIFVDPLTTKGTLHTLPSPSKAHSSMCIPYGPTLHKAGTWFIDAYLFLGFEGTQTKCKGEDLLGALEEAKVIVGTLENLSYNVV